MLCNIFTLDYEIHGNGEGSPYDLMIEPTERILELFDQYEAKLTIMADVAQIMKFKEYAEETGNDLFNYAQIVDQLQRAVRHGHDVQLHIHSSYIKSYYSNGMWRQNWQEYNMAELQFERLNEIIAKSKSFLESIILPVNAGYTCFVFRAANWSMIPSTNIVRALIANNIMVDTSVFKYGKREGIVEFDYTTAHSNLIPWSVSEEDVRVRDPNGKLLEIPIFCEEKDIWSFISINRIYRLLQARLHKHPKTSEGIGPAKSNVSVLKRIKSLIGQKHARKMDFNQCTGNQLINIFRRIERSHVHKNQNIPVVSIGHSKIFTKMNATSLEIFLRFIAKDKNKYCFATFGDFNIEDLKTLNLLS